MGSISFWSLCGIMLIIYIAFIINRKLSVEEFIIVLSLIAGSGVINSLLSGQFNLYYYVYKNFTHVYFIFYDLIVYPAFAILFVRFLLIRDTKLYMIVYNICWICFMTLLELVIIKPFGIIVYNGWRIIPHSIIFYSIAYPIVTIYYIKLKKYIN